MTPEHDSLFKGDGASPARPRQLVVLSGKGGTGKTTVMAGMASLAEQAVLADCDVDAADLPLLLAPVGIASGIFVSGSTAEIVAERCSGCGECARLCRFGAIIPLDKSPNAVRQVAPLACEGCGLCYHVCTCHAVEMRDSVRGEWFVSETRSGPLVCARLGVGGENSGKLVTLVREKALALAESRQAPVLLIDGPPGIACPAIAAATGTDLALLVTEPSVSGAHDLERVVDLLRGLGVPTVVCINKVDLSPDTAVEIEQSCEERGLQVVGRLSYDPEAVAAQRAGRTAVEHGGQLALEIRQMWATIEQMLRSERR